MRGVPTGAVRVSFGYYSEGSDVDKMIALIRENFVQSVAVTEMECSRENMVKLKSA